MNEKKILITGKDSYIGSSVKNWLKDYEYMSVAEVCLKDGSWKNEDFSVYDVVVHVAGIAHSDTKRVSDEVKMLYYQINRDLAIEVAKKAKKAGVRQFIFMSSMIVFGKVEMITADTLPKPTNFYGDSKLQAESGLTELATDGFKVAIIRPPMVYGKNCKGNYQRLAQLAKKVPLFPDVDNVRSMIHIDNLCEFIRLLIENEDAGFFHPQNNSYVKTSSIVDYVAFFSKKKIRLTKEFNPVLRVVAKRIGVFHKLFGDFYYDMSLSAYKSDYRVRSFVESIMLTEL